MPAPTDFSVYFAALEAGELPYCVTGSIASGIYGEPRMTVDIDIVLLLRLTDIGAMRSIFPEDKFYVPPTEMLIGEIRRNGMFNLLHQDGMLKADIFIAGNDPLQHWALEHRRRAEMNNGIKLWVAPPEYVILKKLEYYCEGGSQKHPRDIRFMLACTDVDRAFIEQHIARLGLGEQWAECQ